MYTIYADSSLIYSPDAEALCLYDIVLIMEDNSAGTLSFNITSDHPAFNKLKKLATRIVVWENGGILWKGRIISDDSNIDNVKTIQCEGKLAFLNDSIFPEFSFSGFPETLFHDIIENHNKQVSENQRLKIGRVTVKDNNDYIVRSSKNALKTWKAVKEKCFQSSLGGHVRIRYETDGDYIDWLEDYQEVSSQPISFGKNIIDLLINTSAAEIYTAIRPLGALINNKRVDISSVNDGKKYIIDQGKAEEYGIIYADPESSIWEDVTLPKNLLKKATERLKSGIVLKKTINVQAIDLNLTDTQIEALKVCNYVKVEAALHDIKTYYLLSKAEIHIDSPENTRYTLGAVKETLTDTNRQSQNIVERAMETAIPTDVSQLKNDANYTTETEVKEIINTSGIVAPVISVKTESEDEYILKIQTAAKSFNTPNLKGSSGATGATAYESAVKAGFKGTEAEWIESLKGEPGESGSSAYEVAVQNGYEGTEAEWIESLKGGPGESGSSAYEVAVQNGYEGTEAEWIESLKGGPGESGSSAYEVAVQNGYEGTEAEWIGSLKGKPGESGSSAYEVAVQNGYEGTEAEWIESLKGEPGKDGVVTLEGIEGTEGDVLQYKNGKWTPVSSQGNGNDIIILDSTTQIQENENPGRLVDALVIKQVFQSVSEGKRLIALAITDKGINTSATDTFERMAENIKLIQGEDGTEEGAVLKGIVNIAMQIPEGKPQIANVMRRLNSEVTAVVKSCEKLQITVKEG